MGETSFDVAIVGGGVIGVAIAYFLKRVERFPGSVVLIERDPTFVRAATTLSCSSIRQQFSTAESVRLSLFGPAGLILGPLTLAITIALLDVWWERTAAGRAAEETMANADSAEHPPGVELQTEGADRRSS